MVQVNGNSGAPSGLGPQVAGVWGDSFNDRGVVGTSHGAAQAPVESGMGNLAVLDTCDGAASSYSD